MPGAHSARGQPDLMHPLLLVASPHMRRMLFSLMTLANGELVKDLASGGLSAFRAALSQFDQLRLQRLQAGNARPHVFDMLIDQFIDTGAIAGRMVPKTQQLANFFQRHVERSAVANERQPLDMRLGVEPVVPVTSIWRGEQAFALVIPDRHDLAVRHFCQLANFHRRPQTKA
ncbi:hypothetical protein Pres01_38760 [Metapseudomonas resinovorans]|nr:hypothetical protein Pres01_38760 [Pseudomonas resinovorans]